MTTETLLGTDAARAQLLRMLMGHWVTSALARTTELGVIDVLRENPSTAIDLAEHTGTDPEAMVRLVRFLHALGIVTPDESDRYRATAVGALLSDAHPQSMAPLARLYEESYFLDAWAELGHGLRGTDNPFHRAHGTDVFTYLTENPTARERYSSGIAVGSKFVDVLPDRFDFGPFTHVVDVAGGDGTLIDTVLARRDSLHATLFEQPPVLEQARANLAAHVGTERVDFVAGDFFESVPTGGDLYILCRILHNWDDDEAHRIIEQCRAAMSSGGRLMVIERVVDTDQPDDLSTGFDIHMMVMTGGRERTLAEYSDLLQRNGFELEQRIPLPLGMCALVSAPAGY